MRSPHWLTGGLASKLIRSLAVLQFSLDSRQEQSGAHFLKVPIINGPAKLLLFTCKIEVFNSFASNMIELSVHETKWNSLLARTHAVILYISI